MRIIRVVIALCLGITLNGAAAAPKNLDVLTLTGEENLIVYKDGIGAPGLHQKLKQELTNAPANPILYIQSPGGGIMPGMEIIEIIKARGDVTCITPFAASMAFAILQQCKVRIVSGEMPFIMQHQPQIVLQGQKSLHELEEIVEQFLRPMNKRLAELQAPRLGLTVENFLAKIKNEWNLVGGEEILKNKAADKHLVVRCSPEAAKKTRKTLQVKQGFFGNSVEEISVPWCPTQEPPKDVKAP